MDGWIDGRRLAPPSPYLYQSPIRLRPLTGGRTDYVTDRLWGLLLPQGVGMGPADLRNQTPGTCVALAGCAEGREGLSGIVRGRVPERDEVSGRESPEIT